jgi:hypothetical protein
MSFPSGNDKASDDSDDVQGFLFGEPAPATAFQPARVKLT